MQHTRNARQILIFIFELEGAFVTDIQVTDGKTAILTTESDYLRILTDSDSDTQSIENFQSKSCTVMAASARASACSILLVFVDSG